MISNSTGSTSKRPESVAQRVLRERQERNLKTRFLTETQVQQHMSVVQNRNRRRTSAENNVKPGSAMPLHIALKQTASKHTSRDQTASRIQKEAHMEAVKGFKVIFF